MMKKYILSILLSAFLSAPVFAGWFDDLQTEIADKKYGRAVQRCEQKMSEYSGKEQDDFASMQTYLFLLQENEGLIRADKNFSQAFYEVLSRIGKYSVRHPKGARADFSPSVRGGLAQKTPLSDFDYALRLQMEEEDSYEVEHSGAVASAVARPDRISERFGRNPRRLEIAKRLNPMTMGVEERIRNNTDIHVLDGLITENLSTLLAVGGELGAGNPDLSLEELQWRISSFFEEATRTKRLKITYEDGGRITPLTSVEFNQDVTKFFDDKLKRERDEVRQLISRAWTLAQELFEETKDFQKLDNICVAIIENYKTGGGCIEGRINRMFRAYVLMLEEIGHFRAL